MIKSVEALSCYVLLLEKSILLQKVEIEVF